MESPDGLYALIPQHFKNCTNLKYAQPPSTVQAWRAGNVFQNIQIVVFPKNVQKIEGFASLLNLVSINFSGCTKLSYTNNYVFVDCSKLSSVDLSNCVRLPCLAEGFFYSCPNLTSLDLSECTQLTTLKAHALGCAMGMNSTLASIILPPSLMATYYYAFSLFSGSSGSKSTTLPNLRTIIWKGRSSRPSFVTEYGPTVGISDNSEDNAITLEQRLKAGTLQEIFIP